MIDNISEHVLLKFSFFFRVNVGCGPAEERVLLTGLHAVADIYCECCKTTLGWKYVSICFLSLVLCTLTTMDQSPFFD